MRKLRIIIPCLVIALCMVNLSADADETLTIAWAEWPPADYLQELSKGFYGRNRDYG